MWCGVQKANQRPHRWEANVMPQHLIIQDSHPNKDRLSYRKGSLDWLDSIFLPPRLPPPQQGHLQQGLDFKGLNLNFGGVHSQQQGHIHGNLHLPFLGFPLQHSQQGFLTHAPKVTGKVMPPHPQPLQQQLEHGEPKPPQQLPQQPMLRLGRFLEQRFLRHRFFKQRFFKQRLAERDF